MSRSIGIPRYGLYPILGFYLMLVAGSVIRAVAYPSIEGFLWASFNFCFFVLFLWLALRRFGPVRPDRYPSSPKGGQSRLSEFLFALDCLIFFGLPGATISYLVFQTPIAMAVGAIAFATTAGIVWLCVVRS